MTRGVRPRFRRRRNKTTHYATRARAPIARSSAGHRGARNAGSSAGLAARARPRRSPRRARAALDRCRVGSRPISHMSASAARHAEAGRADIAVAMIVAAHPVTADSLCPALQFERALRSARPRPRRRRRRPRELRGARRRVRRGAREQARTLASRASAKPARPDPSYARHCMRAPRRAPSSSARARAVEVRGAERRSRRTRSARALRAP